MALVGQILVKLGTSSIWGFLHMPVWCPLGNNFPDSKVHGANMGPTWVLSAPDGSMLAPWTLLSGLCKQTGDHSVNIEACTAPHLTCLGLCDMKVWKLIWAICAIIAIAPYEMNYHFQPTCYQDDPAVEATHVVCCTSQCTNSGIYFGLKGTARTKYIIWWMYCINTIRVRGAWTFTIRTLDKASCALGMWVARSSIGLSV